MIRKLQRAFFLFWFWVFGWKTKGHTPKETKYLIVAAPHTSYYDFFVSLAARYILDLKSGFLVKDSMLKVPIAGWFVRVVGGVPVDRSKRTNLVDQVIQMYNDNEEFVLAIAPEGSREYRPEWKSGFYRIADGAKIPMVMVGLNFGEKTVEMREPFYPTGDMEADIEEMKSYFRTIKGKHPEQGVL